MRPAVSWLIAWRYLFGRKSHSAVNAIAAVAVAGVAVATAAMICVLAVFNGFHGLLADRMDLMAPDVTVTPAAGKVMNDGDSLVRVISGIPGVELATATLSDNALLLYEGHETPVRLKGVEPGEFRRLTALDSVMLPGSIPLDGTGAAVSIGTASRIGMRDLDSHLTVFAPKRIGRVNPANPLNSFMVDSMRPTSVYEVHQSEYDDNTIILPIDRVRYLLMYDREASAVEIRALPGTDVPELADRIRDAVGTRWTVRDRLEQQTLSFRMVNVEKWMSFMLLLFILVIASFNIVSTLSMMVVDKQDSMRTLRAMGLSRRSVGGVFACESLLVTALGGLTGIILGAGACLGQARWGWIHLTGDTSRMIVTSYPVELQWGDIGAAGGALALVGTMCAAVAAAFARSRVRTAPE